MTMICEKTGCVAFSDEYQTWMLGDLFMVSDSDVCILKMTAEFTEPPRDRYHITFHEIDAKWDYLKLNNGTDVPTSIVISSVASWYGYDGIPTDGK